MIIMICTFYLEIRLALEVCLKKNNNSLEKNQVDWQTKKQKGIFLLGSFSQFKIKLTYKSKLW